MEDQALTEHRGYRATQDPRATAVNRDSREWRVPQDLQALKDNAESMECLESPERVGAPAPKDLLVLMGLQENVEPTAIPGSEEILVPLVALVLMVHLVVMEPQEIMEPQVSRGLPGSLVLWGRWEPLVPLVCLVFRDRLVLPVLLDLVGSEGFLVR